VGEESWQRCTARKNSRDGKEAVSNDDAGTGGGLGCDEGRHRASSVKIIEDLSPSELMPPPNKARPTTRHERVRLGDGDEACDVHNGGGAGEEGLVDVPGVAERGPPPPPCSSPRFDATA
jgi:hypothetical protein